MYEGDIRSYEYILKTLEASQYFIPGVSCNAELEVAPNAEIAYYWKRASSAVTTAAAAGGTQALTSVGLKRKAVDLTPAIQVYDVIPGVNIETVTVDVVGDRLVQDAIEVGNKRNALGLAALEALTDTLTKDIVSDYNYQRGTSDVKDIVKVLYQARKTFIDSNKARHMKPTAILCSTAFIADLKAANALVFKEWTPGSSQALVGTFDGMAVIETEEMSASNEFIMVNDKAFGCPVSPKNFRQFDATPAGFPGGGVGIACEIRYNFEECDKDLILKVTA